MWPETAQLVRPTPEELAKYILNREHDYSRQQLCRFNVHPTKSHGIVIFEKGRKMRRVEVLDEMNG